MAWRALMPRPSGRQAGRTTLNGRAHCSSFPAIAGWCSGLLGGYLTDQLGRRRVLTFSILLLCLRHAFASGYATSLAQTARLALFVFIGVCEFVAAVAGSAELFRWQQREKVLGFYAGVLIVLRFLRYR